MAATDRSRVGKRRERCSTDPRWQVVQTAKVSAGQTVASRVGREIHAPELDKLLPQLAGLLVRCGAALGAATLADAARQAIYLAGAYLEDRGRDATAEMRALRQEYHLDSETALERLGRLPAIS